MTIFRDANSDKVITTDKIFNLNIGQHLEVNAINDSKQIQIKGVITRIDNVITTFEKSNNIHSVVVIIE